MVSIETPKRLAASTFVTSSTVSPLVRPPVLPGVLYLTTPGKHLGDYLRVLLNLPGEKWQGKP